MATKLDRLLYVLCLKSILGKKGVTCTRRPLKKKTKKNRVLLEREGRLIINSGLKQEVSSEVCMLIRLLVGYAEQNTDILGRSFTL